MRISDWSSDVCSSDLPHPLYLPLKLDAAVLLDAAAHFLPQRFDVGGRRLAEIQQEIAMFFRHLGVADCQAPATGGVDLLPGLVPGGFLKVEPPVRLLSGWLASRSEAMRSLSGPMPARSPGPPWNRASTTMNWEERRVGKEGGST